MGYKITESTYANLALDVMKFHLRCKTRTRGLAFLKLLAKVNLEETAQINYAQFGSIYA